jgi:Rrf2 family protein
MLEIARHYRKGPIKRKDIARRQGISSPYLENILIALKSRNLIRTIRGAHGGFTLNVAPEHISMLEIMTALEGSLVPINCIESSDECNRMEACSIRKFWVGFHDVQLKALRETNLQSLLDLENAGSEIDYSI